MAAPSRLADPLRFGAIDIGTNSLRLVVVEASTDGTYRVLDEERASEVNPEVEIWASTRKSDLFQQVLDLTPVFQWRRPDTKEARFVVHSGGKAARRVVGGRA